VTADSFQGCRDAMTYLVGKGHRRIAHLRGPATSMLSQERFDGYQQGLRDHQFPFDPDLVKLLDFSPDPVDRAMRELIQLDDPPTAVLPFKSYLTLEAISFLQREYPTHPNRLDFVGFGNLPLLRHIDYRPLAAIDADPFDLGTEAFNMLYQRMTQDTTLIDQQVKIPCQLTIY
jgi:DNA-binding LacI/PurR family transcriptional regulator